MKKYKALVSISLVTIMILILGMNGIVFAEENTVISEKTRYEVDTVDTLTSEQINTLDSQPSDFPTSESEAPVLSVSEQDDEIIENGEKEAVGGTSWETAKDINLNQQYSDSLANYDDKNYYAFSLADAGELSITFEHDYVDDDHLYWNMKIFNTNNRNDSFTDWNFKGNDTAPVDTDSLGLPDGNYYVVISAYYPRYSSGNYRFIVNYTKSNTWEKEFNNTFVTATEIPINTDIGGALLLNNDEDYYSFELSKPGRVRIGFDHGIVDSSNSYWNMKLYRFDNPDKSYLDSNFLGNSVKTAYTSYFGLPEGKYIIKISACSPRHSSYNYKLNVNYVESNSWEKENNDSFITANTIETNVDFSGSLQQYDDEDYYSFTIPERDNISFSFKHDVVNSGNGYWKMALFNYNDMNNQLRSNDFIGNETNTVTTSSSFIDAGTYIIKISAIYPRHSDGVYTFRINSEKNITHVTGVSVEPKTVSVNIGESAQLTATVVPEDAANKAVTWKSSNSNVATVDTNGKVTGIKDGRATITVKTDDGGFTATSKVTVGDAGSDEPAKADDPSDPDVELTPDEDGCYNYTLLLGEKYKVNIAGINSKSLATGNNKIVSIADKKNGIVQGKNVGATDVICTVNGASEIIHFKVEYPAISADRNYVLVGDTLNLAIKGTGISNIAWSVNNEKASISDKGVLTGVSAGVTQVTAKIHKKNYKVKITVENPKFAKSTYEVKAGTITKIKLGGTKQGAKVTYSLSDESVATFIPDGRIAALSPGTTTLTANLGNKSFTTQIVIQ